MKNWPTLGDAIESIQGTFDALVWALERIRHGRKALIEDRGPMTPERAEQIFMLKDAEEEAEARLLQVDNARWTMGEAQKRHGE